MNIRYKLRTLLILLAVATAALASGARYLDSQWFADLTGWHGGGGFVVEAFSREIAWKLIALPLIFVLADICMTQKITGQKPPKWFWVVWLTGYAFTAVLCYSALGFSQSARE